ncbi:hypothetical protein B0H19DRAFT_1195984 [Mycena capillaripes]|nr:hypothetical protein B0H19DRAFT_1195984 [Mycena capillaripes]
MDVGKRVRGCAGAHAGVHVQRVWFALAAACCTSQTFPILRFSFLFLSIDEDRSLTLLLSFPYSVATVNAARRHRVRDAKGLSRVRP